MFTILYQSYYTPVVQLFVLETVSLDRFMNKFSVWDIVGRNSSFIVATLK